MFNSPVLDLVILLSFTYFIGSLILSAINEAIAGGLRLRPRQLKFAIENMFFTSDWKAFVKKQFSKSPHIQSLMKRDGRYPAYIPAKSFVYAIIEQFRKAETKSIDKTNLDKINKDEVILYQSGFLSSSIKNKTLLIPHNLKEILLDFANQVEAKYPTSTKQIEEFEKKLEEFYDSAMDRAGGWYKRKARTTLLILALGLSIALNIDTLQIIQSALADKQKLAKAVDNISANVNKMGELKSVTITDTSTSVEFNQESLAATGDSIKKIRLEYEQISGYSFGYKNFKKEWREHFFLKLIGILITSFALQLGSNYWFDLMNKAVNIRAAGKRPDEKRPPQDVVTNEPK